MGHVGACITEAQAYVFFHGHAVPLIGHLVRGGEGLSPNKGIVKHQDPEASWMAPPLGRHIQGYQGWAVGLIPVCSSPLVM